MAEKAKTPRPSELIHINKVGGRLKFTDGYGRAILHKSLGPLRSEVDEAYFRLFMGREMRALDIIQLSGERIDANRKLSRYILKLGRACGVRPRRSQVERRIRACFRDPDKMNVDALVAKLPTLTPIESKGDLAGK